MNHNRHPEVSSPVRNNPLTENIGCTDTDTKISDRCADAPQDPKHMGCIDAPLPYHMQTPLQTYRSTWEHRGHTDVWGAFRHIEGISMEGGHLNIWEHTNIWGHTDDPYV